MGFGRFSRIKVCRERRSVSVRRMTFEDGSGEGRSDGSSVYERELLN